MEPSTSKTSTKPEPEAVTPKASKTAKSSKKEKAPTKQRPVKEPKPTRERIPAGDVCVFAFRLSAAERTRIHDAAGGGKASQFVLAAALAATDKVLASRTKR